MALWVLSKKESAEVCYMEVCYIRRYEVCYIRKTRNDR